MAHVERETRHLTIADRHILREMANRVDAEEILRTVAGIITNDHPDSATGDSIRRKIYLIALDLIEDDSWLCRAIPETS